MRKNSINYLLLISVLLLSIFGLIMIYSASYVWSEYKFNTPYKFVRNQAIFFIIGVLLMYIVSKIHYSFYYKYSKYILLFCILLLILVLIPGIGTVRNGSRSWFGIGSFGIQPSEFTKLALIIFTSKYLTNHKNQLPIMVITICIFGIIMLQPDFGTGTIIVMTIFGILFVNGMKLSLIIKIGLIGIVGVVVLILVAPYRLSRIMSFLNPWSDPLGSGFQIIMSMYAIGPGGVFGLGFGNSVQKHFYLPEPQTDFIFSIISEEFGFVGVLLISILFITLIYTGIKIALNSKDKFSKNLSFGIIFGISFQAILNLMVVVGLIPVTGVTLPFLSYGGSSLLISFLSIGILLNISRYQR